MTDMPVAHRPDSCLTAKILHYRIDGNQMQDIYFIPHAIVVKNKVACKPIQNIPDFLSLSASSSASQNQSHQLASFCIALFCFKNLLYNVQREIMCLNISSTRPWICCVTTRRTFLSITPTLNHIFPFPITFATFPPYDILASACNSIWIYGKVCIFFHIPFLS